ncbi:unnamed protein product [Urochloa decumbens]|uniref:GTD-binding domain-containing protein n=1 Tax=Urochloa decumbens TaxID=240449 RepID=A0ABC9AJS2_9POAL
MAGEDDPSSSSSSSPSDADDAPCPLCGGGGGGAGLTPARVTLSSWRGSPSPAGEDAALALTTAAPGGDEAAALREALAAQRRRAADLLAELEAERGAAEGAASEAMSMILRLQRDKSEAMMEARQYRRYAEERFAHDAAEREALRDALERRDDAVRALDARLRACQARLLHLGFPSPSPLPSSFPTSPTAEAADARRGFHRHALSDDDEYNDYRSVPCLDDRPADVGTPRTHHLLNRMPSPGADKGVVLFGSPCHARTLSGDSVPYSCRVALADEFPLFAADHLRDAPPGLDDDDNDRVYTVDAVHGVPVMAPEDCCYFGNEEVGFRAGATGWAEEAEEIQKLKARLQALEADRESMRHAIMSMGDEKAQVVLLREIAQQLCKDAAPFPAVPLKVQAQPRLQPVVAAQRKVVKKQNSFFKIFILTVIKWVASIFCWRRKSNRIRYPIGMCGSNVGLMLVLDRFPKQRQKKIPKRKLSASVL